MDSLKRTLACFVSSTIGLALGILVKAKTINIAIKTNKMYLYGCKVNCNIFSPYAIRSAPCIPDIFSDKLPTEPKIKYLPNKIPVILPIGFKICEIFKRRLAYFLGPIMELYVSLAVSRKDKPIAIAKIATKNIE